MKLLPTEKLIKIKDQENLKLEDKMGKIPQKQTASKVT